MKFYLRVIAGWKVLNRLQKSHTTVMSSSEKEQRNLSFHSEIWVMIYNTVYVEWQQLLLNIYMNKIISVIQSQC